MTKLQTLWGAVAVALLQEELARDVSRRIVLDGIGNFVLSVQNTLDAILQTSSGALSLRGNFGNLSLRFRMLLLMLLASHKQFCMFMTSQRF